MKLVTDKLNIIVFYDDYECKISTIREHLASFKQYSKHNIFYAVGTCESVFNYDINFADVLIVHYTVRLCLSDYISPPVAEQISNFKGLKLLFIQDEYENTYQAHYWIRKLGINIVFTCVPNEFIEQVYPHRKFPNVVFINNLTGYVPQYVDFKVPSLEKRKNVIVYRGRKLGYWYGSLGQEKYEIGIKMKDVCKKYQIKADIECDDVKRFNNSLEWYNFLLSGRATLGTESGANIFDWDGTLKETIKNYCQANPKASYEEVAKIFLGEDGKILMNQISPKIFQAIMCRTALILYEGEHSGIMQAGKHYISLAKDWKNIKEVIESLKNLDYLSQITENAYNDIVNSGKYSYRSFIKSVEEIIDNYIVKPKHEETVGVPILLNSGRIFNNLDFPSSMFLSVIDRKTRYSVCPSLFIHINMNYFVKVIDSTPAVKGHNFKDILYNNHSTFYTAACSQASLPQFINFSFSTPVPLSKIEIIWFDEENFGIEYSFEYLTNINNNWSVLVSNQGKQVGKHHILEFDIDDQRVTKIRFVVHKTIGEKRMLIRNIRFFVNIKNLVFLDNKPKRLNIKLIIKKLLYIIFSKIRNV